MVKWFKMAKLFKSSLSALSEFHTDKCSISSLELVSWRPLAFGQSWHWNHLHNLDTHHATLFVPLVFLTGKNIAVIVTVYLNAWSRVMKRSVVKYCFVCVFVVSVWRGESSSAEFRPEETRPSQREVNTHTGHSHYQVLLLYPSMFVCLSEGLSVP